MGMGEGATRAAEVLFQASGRDVVLRLRHAGIGPDEMPQREMTLNNCVLRRHAAVAELLVPGPEVVQAAGPVGVVAELFCVSSRVITDDIVWRVVWYEPVECGDAVLYWRVQLAR